ncbi:MAG: type VI secretion system tip protein VgrG [Deltaproteobacteria bacterium]|nr:type VI secretion system tip protein VgrG [Deltaproteobacteria bacterium]
MNFSGADERVWTVVHWQHREGLSELYECSVVITALVGDGGPEGLLARPAELRLVRAEVERTVQGVVRRVEDLGSTATERYARVVMVPALWTLSQRRDSRIFQEQTVAAIVREVLRAAGVYQGNGELEVPPGLEALPPREYCVQYRETDLDFVLRLLQEEGVPFAFREGPDASEALVLFDDALAWGECEVWGGDGAVEVLDASAHVASREGLTGFDAREEMRPTRMTLRDFDFTRPRAHGGADRDAPRQRPRAAGGSRLPGAAQPARVQRGVARLSRARRVAAGAGAPRAAAGGGGDPAGLRHGVVDVAGQDLRAAGAHEPVARPAVPGDGGGARRAVLGRRAGGRARERAAAGGARGRGGGDGLRGGARGGASLREYGGVYSVERAVEAGAGDGAAAGARVADGAGGGASGEEIHTGFPRRIKVQFHWDRVGTFNDGSSCWVRVAQVWAGPGWGSVFIPRIGMEVVVTFLEGDPDRPLVVGCVYNGENHVPYGLPEEKTKSTLKSNSSPTTGGYNEIRFEDRAGEEQVYGAGRARPRHAGEARPAVKVERHRTKLVRGRERNTIEKDRTTTVLGSESKEVMGNQSVEVHGFSRATLHVDEHYHVVADAGLVLECGDSKITMTPRRSSYSRKVKVHGDKLVEVMGELVKINCPDGSEGRTGGKKKKNRLRELLGRMKKGVEKALAKP